MIALYDLLLKERNTVTKIKNLETFIQYRKDAIKNFQAIDSTLTPFYIEMCKDALSELYTDLEANQLILKAIRNEIRMYFEDLKEETNER